MNKYPVVKITNEKAGIVKRFKHPWIFSGAIKNIEKYLDYKKGEIVDVVDQNNNFVCRGYFNQYSQIAIQILTYNCDQIINKDFWKTRLYNAIQLRQKMFNHNKTNSYRLVFSCADYLPGLIVDKYNDYIVVQSNIAGVDNNIHDIVEILYDIIRPTGGIIEKSDSPVRKLEKIENIYKVWYGTNLNLNSIEILENGLVFLVDVQSGQKTGFYLDQKENRQIVSQYAQQKHVLNCFSYTGAFGVYCIANHAKAVVNIDSSYKALELAQKNYELNFKNNTQGTLEFLCEDVFTALEKFKAQNKKYELIILDPPKFVHKMNDMKQGTKAYQKLNYLALKLLPKHGILATFSCSSHVDLALLQKLVFLAALEANREIHILKYLYQSADHPININFPESLYLKGLLLQCLN